MASQKLSMTYTVTHILDISVKLCTFTMSSISVEASPPLHDMYSMASCIVTVLIYNFYVVLLDYTWIVSG